MNEQPLSIGIDGVFTVVTGSMGQQESNYHIIDEERDYRSTSSELSHTESISELEKENYPLDKNEILHEYISNRKKLFDNSDRTKQFSLPEIDSSYYHEKQNKKKRINDSLNYIRKEQHRFTNQMINITLKKTLSNHTTIEIPKNCRPNTNNTIQQQVETLLPFYTLNELAQHNDSTDAWICIFTYIFDITSLMNKTQGTVVYKLLNKYAGQDVSIWFDEQSLEPRKRIDPDTNESVLLMKPLSIIETFGRPFWKTKEFLIGRLIEHCRYVRLIHNFDSKHSYLLEVAEEETIGQIAKKFLKYNSHIFSYIWQYNGKKLDFNKTLTENGIRNEESLHDQYGWRSDNENCPTIILYFSDDLTIA